MAGTFEKLMQIQARAADPEREQPQQPRKQEAAAASPGASTDQKESILQALAEGSSTGALALCIQAIGAGDPAFTEKAVQLMKPASTGEAWRMAFKTYDRHRERIRAVAAADEPSEAAIPVFQEAGQECARIYNVGGNIAQEMAMAVYEALNRDYKDAVSLRNAPSSRSGVL